MERPDLVIGLVAPVGSDLDSVTVHLKESFERVGYQPEPIRVSRLIEDACDLPGFPSYEEADRYDRLMSQGTELRRRTEYGGIAAGLGVVAMQQIRERVRAQEGDENPIAFLLRQLKHKEEVELLRSIYGSRFILVAVTATRGERVDRLVSDLVTSGMERNLSRAHAEKLVARDESETGEELGQQMRKAFPEADVFIDASRHPFHGSPPAGQAIGRSIQLFFGHPFHTPTRDELAMFHAHAAALRSSALGRQVGAAVTDRQGELVATGANEVPKAGGGQYWADDLGDARDFRMGQELSDKYNMQLVKEIVARLGDAGWLHPGLDERPQRDVLNEAVAPDGPASGTRVLDLLEFGRVVHAEMAAITGAARRGVGIKDATLYTTTFPCHGCARHIVAAGIGRVVYREPYPKSRVHELYPDSIAVDEERGDRVAFVPFVGVAPRMFDTVFTADGRKTGTGDLTRWEPATASPRLSMADREADEHVDAKEETASQTVGRLLQQAGAAG